jgi:hypothetical protein
LCTDGARAASDSADRMVSASGKCALMAPRWRRGQRSEQSTKTLVSRTWEPDAMEGGPDCDRTSDFPRVRWTCGYESIIPAAEAGEVRPDWTGWIS